MVTDGAHKGGGRAEAEVRGKGRGSWNAAVVPVYTRQSTHAGVFVYLCGTPENLGHGKDGDAATLLERRREEDGGEPMASQGVLPFRYEGVSVGRFSRAPGYAVRTPGTERRRRRRRQRRR